MLLAQRMSADRLTSEAGSEPTEQELAAGGEAELAAALVFALRANTRAMQAPRRARPEIPWDACHPIPLNPMASNAAGFLGWGDERWTPPAGFAWHVTEIAVVMGAGTTSWTLYRDGGQSGSAAFQFFQSQVSGLLEPRALILMPGNNLNFNSAGGGITVSGLAVEVALDWLPAYLM